MGNFPNRQYLKSKNSSVAKKRTRRAQGIEEETDKSLRLPREITANRMQLQNKLKQSDYDYDDTTMSWDEFDNIKGLDDEA
jgi:hypothetical protein